MPRLPKNRLRVCAGFFSLVALLLLAKSSQSRVKHQNRPQYFSDVELKSPTHLLGSTIHLDARYASKQELTPLHLRGVLMPMLEAYIMQMEELRIETWIAHGTLLGWYWNQRMLPWDTDIDMQLSINALGRLAHQYNHTVFRFSSHPENQSYLLDINPNFLLGFEDSANKIDARWIDVDRGNFIDITALRPDHGQSKIVFCKAGHRYPVSKVPSLYP